MFFSPPTSFGSVADNLWILLYIHVVEPTLYKSFFKKNRFRHIFFLLPQYGVQRNFITGRQNI